MNAKTFLDTYGKSEAQHVAESAGTTYQYFLQLASRNRWPSSKLAKRLVVASGGRLDFIALLDRDQAA